MNTNVRVISAAQGGKQGSFATVNIATDAAAPATPGPVGPKHVVQVQPAATGAATVGGVPGNIPTVIAGATGSAGTLPKNGLATVAIPGYTGPA